MVRQQRVELWVCEDNMVTQQIVELRVSGQYGKTAEGRVKDFRTIW